MCDFLSDKHTYSGRNTSSKEDRPITAKQQTESAARQTHHENDPPTVIAEWLYLEQMLVNIISRDQQAFFTENTYSLNSTQHMHIDTKLMHPAGRGNTSTMIQRCQNNSTGSDRHFYTFDPQSSTDAAGGLFNQPAFGPTLRQHLCRLNKHPGNFGLFFPG